MKTTENGTTSLLNPQRELVTITAGEARLEGELEIPPGAQGVVLFAHGSGSSRYSPRNRYVAQIIRDVGLGTLLFDLLTYEEEQEDEQTGALSFDIELLAERLCGASLWLENREDTRDLKQGYFGASTGGGAALMAAAEAGDRVAAVVSRGGRPDLAGDSLLNVKCPTLLIVGGLDEMVIQLNGEALAKLHCVKELKIIPGATHLFEESGKLEQVAQISAAWFAKYLTF